MGRDIKQDYLGEAEDLEREAAETRQRAQEAEERGSGISDYLSTKARWQETLADNRRRTAELFD